MKKEQKDIELSKLRSQFYRTRGGSKKHYLLFKEIIRLTENPLDIEIGLCYLKKSYEEKELFIKAIKKWVEISKRSKDLKEIYKVLSEDKILSELCMKTLAEELVKKVRKNPKMLKGAQVICRRILKNQKK